jgi:hypothetical protein
MTGAIAAALPLAHLAHWYWYPLYALPALIILWSAIATVRRQRKIDREKERSGISGAQR